MIDTLVNNFFINLVSKFPFLYVIFLKVTFLGSFLFIFYNTILISCIFIILAGITGENKFITKYFFSFLTAILVSSGITYFMKLFFERAGPSGRMLLEIDYSFPSGHATMAAAFFGVIYFLFKDKFKKEHKKYFLFFILLIIFLIGLSRLILNVHFLSDVLVGYLVGVFGLLCGVFVYTKLND